MDLKTTASLNKKTRITMAEELQRFEAKILQGMSQRRAAKAVEEVTDICRYGMEEGV